MDTKNELNDKDKNQQFSNYLQKHEHNSVAKHSNIDEFPLLVESSDHLNVQFVTTRPLEVILFFIILRQTV